MNDTRKGLVINEIRHIKGLVEEANELGTVINFSWVLKIENGVFAYIDINRNDGDILILKSHERVEIFQFDNDGIEKFKDAMRRIG